MNWQLSVYTCKKKCIYALDFTRHPHICCKDSVASHTVRANDVECTAPSRFLNCHCEYTVYPFCFLIQQLVVIVWEILSCVNIFQWLLLWIQHYVNTVKYKFCSYLVSFIYTTPGLNDMSYLMYELIEVPKCCERNFCHAVEVHDNSTLCPVF